MAGTRGAPRLDGEGSASLAIALPGGAHGLPGAGRRGGRLLRASGWDPLIALAWSRLQRWRSTSGRRSCRSGPEPDLPDARPASDPMLAGVLLSAAHGGRRSRRAGGRPPPVARRAGRLDRLPRPRSRRCPGSCRSAGCAEPSTATRTWRASGGPGGGRRRGPRLAGRRATGGSSRLRSALVGAAVVALLLVWSVLSWRQAAVWRDGVTLWTRAVAVVPGLAGGARPISGRPWLARATSRAPRRSTRRGGAETWPDPRRGPSRTSAARSPPTAGPRRRWSRSGRLVRASAGLAEAAPRPRGGRSTTSASVDAGGRAALLARGASSPRALAQGARESRRPQLWRQGAEEPRAARGTSSAPALLGLGCVRPRLTGPTLAVPRPRRRPAPTVPDTLRACRGGGATVHD